MQHGHDKISEVWYYNKADWPNPRSVRIFNFPSTDSTCRGPHGGTELLCFHLSSCLNSCPDSDLVRSLLHRRPQVNRISRSGSHRSSSLSPHSGAVSSWL